MSLSPEARIRLNTRRMYIFSAIAIGWGSFIGMWYLLLIVPNCGSDQSSGQFVHSGVSITCGPSFMVWISVAILIIGLVSIPVIGLFSRQALRYLHSSNPA